MYSPLNYNQLNLLDTVSAPSGVHTTNDATTSYYRRMLFQRCSSVFDFNVPETWDINYLWAVLSTRGYVAVFDSGKYGIIPQMCTLSGIGLFYQPTKASVANALIQRSDMTIGKDCELIRLTPDWHGIWDIVQTYAELLAMSDASTVSSLMNSRVAFVMGAKNKAVANTLKAIFGKISKGELGVVYDQNILRDNTGAEPEPWRTFTRDVGASYVADKTLEAYNAILNRFDEEMGIYSLRGAQATKQERLTNEEIHRNDQATEARIQTFARSLEISCNKVNQLFGTDISIKPRKLAPKQDAEKGDDAE